MENVTPLGFRMQGQGTGRPVSECHGIIAGLDSRLRQRPLQSAIPHDAIRNLCQRIKLLGKGLPDSRTWVHEAAPLTPGDKVGLWYLS